MILRSYLHFASLFALALLTWAPFSHSQQASALPLQPQHAGSTAPQEPTQNSARKTGPKRTKKVWTNENLADAGGTISVVGDARKTSTTQAKPEGPSRSDKAVDPKLISNLRQQLEKLQALLAEVDRQMTDLKDFRNGSSKGSGGIQRNTWEYNSSSVDEQLRTMQAKRSQIQAAIDSVYDNARRKGIDPGALR